MSSSPTLFLYIAYILVYYMCLSIFLYFLLQAYASGCDIVILASDFQRTQIIPGEKHGNIQVGCIDCSSEKWKGRD